MSSFITEGVLSDELRYRDNRIMKARKTMKNQSLIQEVIQQISQRFTPKIPDIKKVSPLMAKPYIFEFLST